MPTPEYGTALAREAAADAPEPIPAVRRITLRAGDLRLSALLAEPAGTPRGVLLALHGGGMTARYFDSRVVPGQSLLALGAREGWTVLALDRPGYGDSAEALPEGQTLAEQSAAVHAALDDFALRHDAGAGFCVLAHSYGGKLALTAAADDSRGRLLGLDISGCGHRYALDVGELSSEGGVRGKRQWGPLGLYPPGTFTAIGAFVAPMPAHERAELVHWPQRFASVAAGVRVPVRFTFADHEYLWDCGDEALTELRRHVAAPRVVVGRLPDAGHNISLGLTAHTYHRQALDFLGECLAVRTAAGVG